MTVKDLEQQILKLNTVERIHVVENILDSLHTPDPKIEKAWIAESEKRYADFKKGLIKSVPYETVLKRLNK
ncbi:MAG: addiction module protein [Candidatus Omnitrophica bacterium]|nr:addiction module protein [Candidatus Omnitrophota bacterium]